MEKNENFQFILNMCRYLIENEYKPCGLEQSIKKRLYELILIWEKNKKRATMEGREIGGLQALFTDVLRAVEKARADERRFKKRTKCQYLKKGVETPIGEVGALGNWFLGMREGFRT